MQGSVKNNCSVPLRGLRGKEGEFKEFFIFLTRAYPFASGGSEPTVFLRGCGRFIEYLSRFIESLSLLGMPYLNEVQRHDDADETTPQKNNENNASHDPAPAEIFALP